MTDKENTERPLDPTPEDNPGEASKPATIEEQLEAANTERADMLSRLQRVSADYMNYQKRVQREKSETRDFIVGDVVAAMLDVMDDLQLVIGHAQQNHPADDPLLAGAQMVANKAAATFKRFDVEPIETEGRAFDPQLHEAIQTQPSADVEPMTIMAEVRRGYTLKGRTLRPSRVVVAQAVPQEDHAPADANDQTGGGDDADV